jgi:hypothetical protein
VSQGGRLAKARAAANGSNGAGIWWIYDPRGRRAIGPFRKRRRAIRFLDVPEHLYLRQWGFVRSTELPAGTRTITPHEYVDEITFIYVDEPDEVEELVG